MTDIYRIHATTGKVTMVFSGQVGDRIYGEVRSLFVTS